MKDDAEAGLFFFLLQVWNQCVIIQFWGQINPKLNMKAPWERLSIPWQRKSVKFSLGAALSNELDFIDNLFHLFPFFLCGQINLKTFDLSDFFLANNS